MTKSATIHGPRITVQYEITGEENDEELAAMKRLERDLEKYLATILEAALRKVMLTDEENE